MAKILYNGKYILKTRNFTLVLDASEIINYISINVADNARINAGKWLPCYITKCTYKQPERG